MTSQCKIDALPPDDQKRHIPKLEPAPLATNGLALRAVDTACPDLEELLPMLTNPAATGPEGADLDAYIAMLDRAVDISDTDKQELVWTLWQIIETLIGLQFGLDPAQAIFDVPSVEAQNTQGSVRPDSKHER